MKPKRTVKIALRKPPRRAEPKLRARAAVAEDDYDVEDYEAEAEPNMRFSHALFVVLVLHVIAVAGVFAFNSIKAGQSGAFAKEVAEASAKPSPTASAPAAKPLQDGRTHTVAAGDTLTRLASQYGTSIEAIERENGISTYSLIRVGQVLKIPEPGKALPAVPEPAVAKALPEPVVAKALPEPAAKASPEPVVAKASPAVVDASKVSTPAPSVDAKAVAPVAAPPAPAVPAKQAAGADVYVVAKGDNPYSIAKKLKVSYKQLVEVNGIEDPTKIQIGQKLKVPKPNP